MASVRQIAASAGVSVATVSRALNNHPNVDPRTRDRVLDAANRAGYTMTVGKRVTTVVGLVYADEIFGMEYGSFDAALVPGILRGLNDLRFDLQIVALGRDKGPDETYTQFFMRKGLRAVILRTVAATRHVCKQIADEGFPAVVVADRFEEPQINFVGTDSKAEFRRAVEHILDLGHRRIALGMHNVADTDHADRRAAVEEALASRGLSLDPALVSLFHSDTSGGAGFVTRMMSLPTPPTALVLTNPLSTFGAVRRCAELGIKVPEDVSIVGFDDSDLRRHMFPVCTAVCQNAERLGFEAANWLTRFVTRGESAPGRGPDSAPVQESLRLRLPALFEVNQTTGEPPQRPMRIFPNGARVASAPLPPAGASGYPTPASSNGHAAAHPPVSTDRPEVVVKPRRSSRSISGS